MLWRGGEITPLVPVRIMPAQGSVLRSKFPRTAPRPTLRSCLRSAMNANGKFFARDAHVDNAAVQPLPNSKKIFVEGSRPDVRVPRREVAQSDTPASFGVEDNPPIVVYDTSGPYTDPAATIDIRQDLPAVPAHWMAGRADSLGLSPLSAPPARH